MKKYRILLIVSISLLFAFSCEESSDFIPEDKFVLQAYLYANEAVWDVSMRKTVPLTEADSIGESINDAQIKIIKEGIEYYLVSTGHTGYYYYPGDDLIISAYDQFNIEAEYDGRIAVAETTVP